VTTTVSDASVASADELRAKLADRLVKDNTVRTAAVEAAFRQVRRDLFLPGIPLRDAYADEPVYTKHDGIGTRISAASQPKIVAMMLEQLQIQPGQRILELGAGTGYNAALMATATGETGQVTTVDVDADLVTGARQHLAASIGNVEVILADGALGHPEAAPFDRVIATVGAFEVPTAWLEQLAPGGAWSPPCAWPVPPHAASSSNATRTGGSAAAATWRYSCPCAASATTPAASSTSPEPAR
jgi:protein-L-isoaspartate(D-aspartate) O-methyltransferase